MRILLATILLLATTSTATATADEIDNMLDLWDYSKPGETAVLLHSLLEDAKSSENIDYLPALISQIARTHSIRRDFDRAHELLDEVQKLVAGRETIGKVFYLLERGRAYNSSGDRASARFVFEEAFRIAEVLGDDYLAVDAAHMLGIAEVLRNQMKWNVIALGIAEASDEPRARQWLGSLYNNMGWTYFEQQEYDEALDLFQKAVDFRREQGQERRVQIARWAVGRTYRALGRYDDALRIQKSLEKENMVAGQPDDGYVMEELAELYLLKNDGQAPGYFERAYHLLSKDEYLKASESDRLARLKRLAND